MRAIKRSLNLPGVLLLLALCALLAHEAIGQRSSAARPTVVATVDLRAVINGLDQRAAAAADVERMKAELEGEDEQRTAEIQAMLDRRQNLPETDVTARKSLEEQIQLKRLEYEAWARMSLEENDIEKSLLWRDLERSVRAAIALMAKSEGFDIVLVDDSGQEVRVNLESRVSRESQVTQQLFSRRLLFADTVVDITDELIERMNNAYKSGP